MKADQCASWDNGCYFKTLFFFTPNVLMEAICANSDTILLKNFTQGWYRPVALAVYVLSVAGMLSFERLPWTQILDYWNSLRGCFILIRNQRLCFFLGIGSIVPCPVTVRSWRCFLGHLRKMFLEMSFLTLSALCFDFHLSLQPLQTVVRLLTMASLMHETC